MKHIKNVSSTWACYLLNRSTWSFSFNIMSGINPSRMESNGAQLPPHPPLSKVKALHFTMKLHSLSGAQACVCTPTPATGSHISQAGVQNDLSASTSRVLALQARAKHAWFMWCRSSNPRLYVQRASTRPAELHLWPMSSAFWKAGTQKALWGYFAQV